MLIYFHVIIFKINRHIPEYFCSALKRKKNHEVKFITTEMKIYVYLSAGLYESIKQKRLDFYVLIRRFYVCACVNNIILAYYISLNLF